MHPDLVSVLRCPVCGDALALTARTANCPQRHAFDLAKQGYLNLLPSASTGIDGDSAEMVEARDAFLAGGFYGPIREALVAASLRALEEHDAEVVAEDGAEDGAGGAEDGAGGAVQGAGGVEDGAGGAEDGAGGAEDGAGGAVHGAGGVEDGAGGAVRGAEAGGMGDAQHALENRGKHDAEGGAQDDPADDSGHQAGTTAAGLVVEVGAGTGYYLAGVVAARARLWGLGLDVSRYAARRAARVDPERIGAVVCDAWRELPVQDAAARVVLNVFAPRNATEMARILAPGGVLLVVTPNQAHLAELIAVLGLVKVDEEKERRLSESLSGSFERTGSESVEVAMRLDHAAVERLVAMTPSARHTAKDELAGRIAVLADPVEVTLSVTLSTWRTV
ncbi:putative RNA methyltransferase [Kribbella sp. NPDC056861]|uniref:putative RNA methyltransferase n=1 Tax=Kribbella sp. NPDC056861 TaxID=3154857 RepID=UPI003418D0D6